MIDFFQTDPGLDLTEQKTGCAFLCGCYIAPTRYTIQEVNCLYHELYQVHFVDADVTILDWASVLNSIDARLHFKMKTLEGYFCGPGEREIIKWYLSNVKENHFTVGDGKSHTMWDSMNRPDIMSQYATFVEKVIVSVTIA
jgi:hypothetical protein